MIVRLEVSIDDHGNVVSTHPLSGRADLRKIAYEEARRMKFEPPRINGTSVGLIKTLVFDYSEKEKKPHPE
jgi:outer membrane biosynthesis protein TonB